MALNNIDQKRNGKISHMAIQLPVINMALVEAHQELAKVCRAAKDMTYKSKKARKGVEEAV